MRYGFEGSHKSDILTNHLNMGGVNIKRRAY